MHRLDPVSAGPFDSGACIFNAVDNFGEFANDLIRSDPAGDQIPVLPFDLGGLVEPD